MGQQKLIELSNVSLTELEETLLSNRAYLGEAILPDLLSICNSRGDATHRLLFQALK